MQARAWVSVVCVCVCGWQGLTDRRPTQCTGGMDGNTNNMSLVCLVRSRDYNCRTKHKHSPRASRVASAPSQFHATPHGRSRLLLPLRTHVHACVRVFSAPSLRAPERQVILFNMLSSLMLLPPSDGDCTPLLVAFVRTRGAGPHQ